MTTTVRVLPVIVPAAVRVFASPGNGGIVPPWLADPVLPLPDPVGDTPWILPVDWSVSTSRFGV